VFAHQPERDAEPVGQGWCAAAHHDRCDEQVALVDQPGSHRLGCEARASDAGEPASTGGRSASDQALLMKFGLLGGAALIVIVVIILLINVLFNRPAKPAQQTAQPPAATVQADPVQTLTLTAIEATRVKVVQDLDGTSLFAGALARGEARTFKKQGTLLITVEAGKNLRMEVNGRSYPVPLDGYGRFRLE